MGTGIERKLEQDMPDKTHSTYDEVPYESHPFPESHPDRLATMALLFGMQPAPVQQCRVLELGCAAGGNLIPIAAQFPKSEFIGIDLAARQIADGKAQIAALGLRNIRLLHQSILDFDVRAGEFDYIICHGVYSWVPDKVQDKVLEICERQLEPQGVAYISYNTYPGWHFRGMIRDMMIYHTRELTDPVTRVGQARALLDFLSQVVPTENNAYGIMLRNELDLLRGCRDSYLFHEHLEDANHPTYFHQFMERAARHGLQYLGETSLSAMLTSNFSKEIADTLRRISNDIIRTEQYMDFVRNRTFRQTLLCRRGIPLERNLTPDRILPFHFASPAKPLAAGDGRSEAFQTTGGATFTPVQPLVKAAFHYLTEIWPRAVSFDELYAAARARTGAENASAARKTLAADVLTSYTANIVELRTHPANFVTAIGTQPKASLLAREQARLGRTVTNQRHEPILLDDLNWRLLPLLDGARDRSNLIEELVRMAVDGVLLVQQEDTRLTDGEALRTALALALDRALTHLARSALLVA